jgi:hypothetical protein
MSKIYAFITHASIILGIVPVAINYGNHAQICLFACGHHI